MRSKTCYLLSPVRSHKLRIELVLLVYIAAVAICGIDLERVGVYICWKERR